MILHCLISAHTHRHGGKKSAGTTVVDIPQYMAHLTPSELSVKFAELHAAGYTIDVWVTAHRDKRPAKVRVWYPANPCPQCRNGTSHVAEGEVV